MLSTASRWTLPLLLVLALAPARAAAQRDDVAQLLAGAVTEYDGGNYAEAYALFLRVHQLQPTARTARALGKTSFELRRYREAVEWLEASLADQRSPLTAEMRTELEALLARARASVGRFTIHANVHGATVEVDGAPAASAVMQFDIGDHEIVARAEGYEPQTRRLTVHGGEDETVELVLVRARAAGQGGGATIAREDPGAVLRQIGWVSLISGVALGIGGAVAHGIWADTVSRLNANLDSGACTADPTTESVLAGSPAECFDQQSRYRLALPFIFVGYIGGGALIATGLGLILGAPRASIERAAALSCDPFADLGVSCQLRF